MTEFRIERDSMGELKVPADALYKAQTQRAVNNFPISGLTMPRAFIRALGLIKASAAKANCELGELDQSTCDAIVGAAQQVAAGEHDAHFPVDVFQTGSGTSSNMNANEVIASLATAIKGEDVHPNDHVNMGQSSNDVIPTAIAVSAVLETEQHLLPALQHLCATIESKAKKLEDIPKTGRTHLMDAMPVTFGQELRTWGAQMQSGQARIQDALERIRNLPQGGTAVGTGINALAEFGGVFCKHVEALTDVSFRSANNKFESISSVDGAAELSAQFKTLACGVMKIANDLRWMNSGPLAGLGEIALPALQPGSSIMPGKVNPVIPESAAMVCAQVIGNDSTITVAAQSGNFQLNVMLPVVGYNLLQSIDILANATRAMADDAIAGFTVNEEKIRYALERNPILVTALNPVIGYEKGAATAKQAYKQGDPIKTVARETTGLSDAELDRLLDPKTLTKGGIHKA